MIPLMVMAVAALYVIAVVAIDRHEMRLGRERWAKARRLEQACRARGRV